MTSEEMQAIQIVSHTPLLISPSVIFFFSSSSSFSPSLQHAAAASSLLWSSVEILSLYSTRGAVGLIAHAVESAGAVGEVEVLGVVEVVLLHPFPLPRLV